MNQIETLAAEMNVTVSDLTGFVAALSVWMRRGYTLEQAIEKNAAQMLRLAEHALEIDARTVAVECFYS